MESLSIVLIMFLLFLAFGRLINSYVFRLSEIIKHLQTITNNTYETAEYLKTIVEEKKIKSAQDTTYIDLNNLK